MSQLIEIANVHHCVYHIMVFFIATPKSHHVVMYGKAKLSVTYPFLRSLVRQCVVNYYALDEANCKYLLRILYIYISRVYGRLGGYQTAIKAVKNGPVKSYAFDLSCQMMFSHKQRMHTIQSIICNLSLQQFSLSLTRRGSSLSIYSSHKKQSKRI